MSCRIGVVLCELHSSSPVWAVLVAVISSPEEQNVLHFQITL